MSTLDASTISIQEAMTAWASGMPQANSMEHARLAWAPYLAHWGRHMEKGFFHSIEGNKDTSILGWIEDQAFWQSFWRGMAQERSLDGLHDKDGVRIQRMAGFLQEAAFLGNTVPMQTFFEEFGSTTMVRRAMIERSRPLSQFTTPLYRQEAIAWLQAHPGEDEDEMARLVESQTLGWAQLEWFGTHFPKRYWVYNALAPSMAQVVDLVADAFEHGYCPADAQLKTLGCVILNAPKQWHVRDGGAPHLLDMLQTRLTPFLGPDLDLKLIALCSGCGYGETVLEKSIDALGADVHARLQKQPPEGRSVPLEPELGIIESLYSFDSAQALYHVLLQAQLHKGVPTPAPSISLDGMLEHSL